MKTKYSFRTHNGEVLTPDNPRLVAACESVAQWYENNAHAIRRKDRYAKHVTEERKEENLQRQLEYAESIRQRENLNNFSVWQRVNAELTGECIAFLPKTA